MTTQTDVQVSGLGADSNRPAEPPPAVVAAGGSYEFMATQPGEDGPVTYNPCETIEIEVNTAQEPPGGRIVLQSALHRVSRTTGLAFEVIGTTDRIPDQGPGLFNLTGRSEPVLIAWVTPEQVPDLEGNAGLGGSGFVENEFTGRRTYVTGEVSLDVATFNRLLTRPGLRAHAEAIVLHELGHLVGLAHVDDRNELMFDGHSSRTSFGPGDLAGLAALGSPARSSC